ncbi:uncharacterized protein [Lolium perenne]|uniref:uncharacterized protein isoform X2 n=1 Tax=Lolium perenne TaxID=4522 RepID=UPI003A9A2316
MLVQSRRLRLQRTSYVDIRNLGHWLIVAPLTTYSSYLFSSFRYDHLYLIISAEWLLFSQLADHRCLTNVKPPSGPTASCTSPRDTHAGLLLHVLCYSGIRLFIEISPHSRSKWIPTNLAGSGAGHTNGVRELRNCLVLPTVVDDP